MTTISQDRTVRTVLITGASSGIGKACALHLADKGFSVFAGVRREEDGRALRAEVPSGITPVLLDVTDAASVADAAAQVADITGGAVDALVNNAGVGRGGALEATDMQDVRAVFEVNVLGLIAMTKAMIPLLLPKKGRIVNIGSTSSFLAIPGAAVYSASKFAVRALTDSLRNELHHLGVRVILVAPGAIESSIWEKGRAHKQRMRETVSADVAARYAPLRRFGEHIEKEIRPIPAQRVATIVERALTAVRPKPYYLVGADAAGAAKVARMPKWLTDRVIRKRIETVNRKGGEE
jgi:NAD(P)-dependent dehydrogenase (short-subunit alcohol dehydrogenase family)